MSSHVPEDLMAAFVDGDVGEQLAIHIAEHIDSCPACATQASSLEPLASAFASLDDPEPPPDLAAAVMAAFEQPERAPVLEMGMGMGFLATAAVLFLVTQNPIGVAVDLGVWMATLAAAGSALWAALASTTASLAVVTLAALGSMAAGARATRPMLEVTS